MWTYSTLIHELCERNRFEEAFELFENMEIDCVGPNIITVNVLISGFWKSGRVEKSIELFMRMMVGGCEPSSNTYQEILYCLVDRKKFAYAKDFMSNMVFKGRGISTM